MFSGVQHSAASALVGNPTNPSPSADMTSSHSRTGITDVDDDLSVSRDFQPSPHVQVLPRQPQRQHPHNIHLIHTLHHLPVDHVVNKRSTSSSSSLASVIEKFVQRRRRNVLKNKVNIQYIMYLGGFIRVRYC